MPLGVPFKNTSFFLPSFLPSFFPFFLSFCASLPLSLSLPPSLSPQVYHKCHNTAFVLHLMREISCAKAMTGVLEELDSLYCSESDGPRYWQDAGNKRIANVLSIGDTEVPVTLFPARLCASFLVQSLKLTCQSRDRLEITPFLLTEIRNGPNGSTIPSETDDRFEHWWMRSA